MEVAEIVAATAGLPLSEVSANTRKDETESWDSFTHISIIAAIETRLEVSFSVSEIATSNSVADLVSIVGRKK